MLVVISRNLAAKRMPGQKRCLSRTGSNQCNPPKSVQQGMNDMAITVQSTSVYRYGLRTAYKQKSTLFFEAGAVQVCLFRG